MLVKPCLTLIQEDSLLNLLQLIAHWSPLFNLNHTITPPHCLLQSQSLRSPSQSHWLLARIIWPVFCSQRNDKQNKVLQLNLLICCLLLTICHIYHKICGASFLSRKKTTQQPFPADPFRCVRLEAVLQKCLTSKYRESDSKASGASAFLSLSRYFDVILKKLYLSQILSYPNKPYINGKLIYSNDV